MFRPLKMKKLKIIGLVEDLDAALVLWRRLGLVQLEYTQINNAELQKGQPLPIYQEISEQLLKIRTIKKYLIPTQDIKQQYFSKSPLEHAREINIESELAYIEENLKTLLKEKENITKQIEYLKKIEEINIDFSTLPTSLDYYLFEINIKDIDKFKEELNKITKDSLFLEKQIQKDKKLIFLAIKKSTNIENLEKYFARLEIPSVKSTFKEERLKLEISLMEIENKLKKLLYQKINLSEKYYNLIVALEEALEQDAKLALEALKFPKSSNCYYAEGWLKEEDFEKFKNTNLKFFKSRILIAEIPPSIHHYKDCPTELKNPKILQPFEDLLKFLYIPNAKEIDPTAIIFLTIPIVYGMIIADVGYGILSLIISLFILSKAKKGLLRSLALIWLVGSIPTILFGIMFDEYFGFEHEHILGEKIYEPILHRVDQIQLLLIACFAVGWISIALGFILGAINNYEHSKKHAAAKIFWIFIQIGLTLSAIAFLAAEYAQFMNIGLIIFGIGVLGELLTEGANALIEIPGLVSNIMSYSRITAVGVAGLLLAEAINDKIFPHYQAQDNIIGLLSFIFMFLIYTILHFANTAVAMFEGLIHSGRLTFLEFFTKFFQGGGRLFSPLKLTREYYSEIDHANLAKKQEKEVK